MIALPAKPCQEMTAEDFMTSWSSFLERLHDFGANWIRERGGILTDGLLGMWDQVLGGLLSRLGEFWEIIQTVEDREALCQIVWGIGAWDPTGPFGGIGGGVPGTFVSARMIKEAVERWLAPRLSQETRDLLRALNQLLCMLRCL